VSLAEIPKKYTLLRVATATTLCAGRCPVESHSFDFTTTSRPTGLRVLSLLARKYLACFVGLPELLACSAACSPACFALPATDHSTVAQSSLFLTSLYHLVDILSCWSLLIDLNLVDILGAVRVPGL
jgi:hypothetical protein